MVTETSCSLSRAKVRVASREPVSNVECEGTRLTDAGRKERVKESRETGRKEKEDRKEREEQKENGQIQVTRGLNLEIIPIHTAKRLVLRWIRWRMLKLFCAVSLKTSCEEFSEPKHVRNGHCTNTLQLENSETFAHENRFSLLASGDDEKSLGDSDVAKPVTKIKSRTWKIGGERDDGFSCRDERRRIGGERDDEFSCRDERVDECIDPEINVTCHRTFNASQSNAHHVSYLAKSEVDSIIMWETLDGKW